VPRIRLIARRDVDVRENTLYGMLFETFARAEAVLDLNIEGLDLAGRGALVWAKRAVRRRRRGVGREDVVLETVYRDAGGPADAVRPLGRLRCRVSKAARATLPIGPARGGDP